MNTRQKSRWTIKQKKNQVHAALESGNWIDQKQHNKQQS